MDCWDHGWADRADFLLTMGMVVGHKRLFQYLVGFYQVQVQRKGFTRFSRYIFRAERIFVQGLLKS